ncbi:tRNA (adenine(22)-N(1))-methyltransferase [Anaerosporobacter faecicola]|uniref:tRNA (adenine(22)-N(1))-methyltransferase n=1 Tax=Anaerosporobacter faecicola TaxID=2718714 RepID=UPI00143A99EC|nr:class I SAM-dependent methyltransferase [Anaerosporobacter faecicola]
MQISKRLRAAVALVTKNNRVADIGCDHAYTSIYLVENKIASKVIACDINKGPLERAKENIAHYGYDSVIETRLSDGAKKITPGEVDTLFLSGMGGALVVKILSQSKEVTLQCNELILQPQSEIFLVRRYLHDIGFEITKEDMVIDDGKYYVMMRATKTDEEQQYTSEAEYLYGAELLKNRNPILLQFLHKEKNTYEKILSTLEKTQSDNSMKRISEVKEQLEYIEEGLGYYDM